MAEPWRTSTHRCVGIFRDALVAMIPLAERARITWREPQTYDDWDRIASALFQSFVADALAHARECPGWPPLAEYDLLLPRYEAGRSRLLDATEGPSAPFVRLETSASPFDTCVFTRIDARGTTGKSFRKSFAATTLHAAAGPGTATHAGDLTVDL